MTWWHTWYPTSNAFAIGPIVVSWYGAILIIAIIAGFLGTRYIFKKKQIPLDHLYGLLFWLLVAGIVGGRIGNIIAEWQVYAADPSHVLRIWDGGISFHGVLIAAMLTVYWYCRHYRLSFWLVADSIAVAAPLMQAIGRWGNYFNQELYGTPSDVPWAIPIAPVNRPATMIDYVYYHPLFVYESLLMLGTFLILWILWRRETLRDGHYVLLYIILFSVIRFGLDFLRINPPEIGPLSIAQWLSVVFVGGALLLWHRRLAVKDA